MAVPKGDAYLRAGTNDPKVWQIVDDAGTPIDITGFSKAELVMTKQSDGVKIVFSTDDIPKKFAVTDASTGEVTFSPATSDFTSKAVYAIYVLIVIGSTTFSAPEESEYVFTVRT